jgi:hypothetical protein
MDSGFETRLFMKIPAWIVKLAAAAVIPALIGVGAALSAPSATMTQPEIAADEAYEPGMDGVDYAAVTGPRAPADADAVPACADPARRGDLRPCL